MVAPEVHHVLDGAVVAVLQRAGHVVLLVELAARDGDAAVGHGHGAAGDVALLDEDDALALLQQARAGDQAHGARADDDDVGLGALLALDDLGLDLGGEVGRIIAGLLDGLLHGALDGHGGDGAAAHVRHVDALVGDDRLGDAGAGVVADAHGLLVGEHLAGGDLALEDGGGHVDVALMADGAGHILAVHLAGGALGGGGDLLRGALGFGGCRLDEAERSDADGAGRRALDEVASADSLSKHGQSNSFLDDAYSGQSLLQLIIRQMSPKEKPGFDALCHLLQYAAESDGLRGFGMRRFAFI